MKTLAMAFFVLLTGGVSANALDERHVRCIAHVVYGEARGEPLDGQYAVAWSIMFRAAANLPEFGGLDLCRVAYKQTSRESRPNLWQYDGAKVSITDHRAWRRAVMVARRALLGHNNPARPVMYFCDAETPHACRWHDRRTHFTGRVGNHRFYTDARFPGRKVVAAQ